MPQHSTIYTQGIPMTNRIRDLRGDALVTLSMLMFGGYALFLNLLPKIPVVSFLFAMQAVGMIVLFAKAIRQGFPKTTPNVKWLLLALAIATTANDLTYFYAFRLTSVANASVAHQLVSIFLLFLAPLLLHERTEKSEWISLAVALLGILILFGRGLGVSSHDAIGITFGVLSAFFYALFVLIYRHLGEDGKGYTISFLNFWRYLLSTLILLPFIPYFGGFGIIRENFWSLIAFGILFAVIASGIHNLGIARTRPLHVSIIGKSEPVIATLYAFFFLGQVPAISALIGSLLIIGASVWLAFQKEN
jgi:drug/metabolite transporter (DMT)-like permease